MKAYEKILVLQGRLLSPSIKTDHSDKIVVMVEAETANLPIPSPVSGNDKFYSHDTKSLGRFEAKLFLKLIEEGITLFRDTELINTRIFIRIVEGYVHIFTMFTHQDNGTYVVHRLEDFLKEFKYERDEFFVNIITYILKNSQNLLKVDTPSYIASQFMNWDGREPKKLT